MILVKTLKFIKNVFLWRKEYLPFFKRKFEMFGKNVKIEHPSNIQNSEFISLGNNTTILRNSRIQVYNNLTGLNTKVKIGDCCFFGYNLSILAGGDIEIGNNVLIASNVLITSEDHGINPESDVPYMSQPLVCKPIIIGDGVWIGEKVSILSGVKIGKKCIIGTNAVVTKDIPDYSIAVGIPAKVVKTYNFDTHKWEKV